MIKPQPSRRRHPRHASLIAPVIAAAGLLMAACSGSAGGGVTFKSPPPQVASSPTATPTVSPPPSPTPRPPMNERQKIIAGYLAYNDGLPAVETLPAAKRPAAVAKFAVDPLYSAILKELAARDRAGKVGFGRTIANSRIDLVVRDHAAIRDCSDSSQSGLMDKATGKKLTIGRPTDLWLSTMLRGRDGVWRVATAVLFPSAKC